MDEYKRDYTVFSPRSYSMYGSHSSNICGRRCSKLVKSPLWIKCSCKKTN